MAVKRKCKSRQSNESAGVPMHLTFSYSPELFIATTFCFDFAGIWYTKQCARTALWDLV